MTSDEDLLASLTRMVRLAAVLRADQRLALLVGCNQGVFEVDVYRAWSAGSQEQVAHGRGPLLTCALDDALRELRELEARNAVSEEGE